MAASHPEVLKAGFGTGQPSCDVLHAFYLHLGRVAIEGIASLDGATGWRQELVRAGHEAVAGEYGKLLAVQNDPASFSGALLDMLWSTGNRLRALDDLDDEPDGILVPAVGEQHDDAPRDEEVLGEDEVKRQAKLIRVGSLRERRVAASTLGRFLHLRRNLAREELGQMALDALVTSNDASLTVEVTEGLARLGLAESKRARASIEKKDALFARLEQRVGAYWDGASPSDPLEQLADADLVTMGIWLRRGTDYLAGHVAEFMTSRLARGDNRALASVVSAMVPSGDARLLPVIVRVLQDARLEARLAAIKTLAHIEDPRSHAALLKARRHATDTLERLMLARALSSFGDHSGAGDILGRLGEDTPEFVREEALKAVGLLPEARSVDRAAIDALLDEDAGALALAALRALSYIGDADTVKRLEEVATSSGTLRSAASRAAGDLRARLALGGDERFDLATTAVTSVSGDRPGIVARMRSVMFYLIGLVLLLIGRFEQAGASAAKASSINPVSAKGHFLEALALVKEGRDEAALSCYRRGLTVDPHYAIKQWGEANRILVTYLRLADELTGKHDRRDEAIELLEETEFIDLRSADPNLKIEVDRRLDSLKLERRRERLGPEGA